jgi:CelD/BcsL family acetyltransferase involved in cellulose biosynthesis
VKATVERGEGVARDERERWAEVLARSPHLSSPFFRPEYTEAVAAVRGDVLVACVESGGTVAGFFPFHRSRLGFGIPVGGGRTNYDGPIIDPTLGWDPKELVRASGLRAHRFRRVPAAAASLGRYESWRGGSSVLDLSRGFDGYVGERMAAGSKVVAKTERQARMLERDVGPLRFEAQSPSTELLRLLMRWKSDQWRRTGDVDRFSVGWNVELLDLIHGTDQPDFGGLLSVLHAGERVAALALLLRSKTAGFLWFPTYDPDLSTYSPGMILLLRMAEDAAKRGILAIDLGAADALYKTRLRTGVVELVGGQVAPSTSLAALTRAWGKGGGVADRIPYRVRVMTRKARLSIGGASGI